VIIDAPTGAGKTELMSSFIQTNPDYTYLAVYSRTAMCRTARTRFNFDFYKENEDGWQSKKLVCTLDHLSTRRAGNCYINKLGVKYDVLILDECGMTKDHTISNTITPRIHSVLTTLRELLEGAKIVFLVQHQLTLTDVTFFMSFCGDDIYNNEVTKRYYVDAPLILHPIR
jgi:hypothetical protein